MRRLEIEIVVGAEAEPWRASLAGCPDWQPSDPLANPELLKDLETLRELSYQPLPTTEHGQLTAEAAGIAATLHALARDVGDRLTDTLLSPPARQALVQAVHSGLTGDPPLLHLKVRPSGSSWTSNPGLTPPGYVLSPLAGLKNYPPDHSPLPKRAFSPRGGTTYDADRPAIQRPPPLGGAR